MRTEMLDILKAKAEEKYRIFSAKFLPPATAVLGVRIPCLRQIAKQMVKEGSAASYLQVSPSELHYHEEQLLYALLVANVKLPPEQKIPLVKNFVPYIGNWAVCDVFCAELKEIKKNPAVYYNEFLPYLQSGAEYQIRFFYVVALGYFLTPELLSALFSLVARQQYIGYYDKMAAAWLISVAYVKYPTETERFLIETPIDSFVFRKSISKICDSFRVEKEAKIRLRTLASTHKL